MQVGQLPGMACGYLFMDAGGGGPGDDTGEGWRQPATVGRFVASLVDVSGEGFDRGEVALVGLGSGGEHFDDRDAGALGPVGDRSQQRGEGAVDALGPRAACW